MKPRTKRRWTRSDKMLVIVPFLLTLLAFSLFFWLRTLDKPPVVRLPPPPAMPAVNAYDYFLAAANAAAVTGSVAPNSEALRLLHQGFQYPCQRPPHSASGASLLSLTKQISNQAQTEAGAGQWAASADAGLDLVEFGVAVTHGVSYSGAFTALRSQRLGYKHLRGSLNHLDAAQAQRAARRLEIIRLARVPFASSVTQENGEAQELLLAQSQSQWRVGCIWTDTSLLTAPGAWMHEVSGELHQRMMSNEQIFSQHQNYYAQVLAAVQHHYAARPPAPPVPDIFMDQITLATYSAFWTIAVNADTQNSLLMTEFALRSYKLDHGAYPKTLAALVPHYLTAPPPDPFALSGPLRYKQAGASYLLYSIGPDGRDNGGKAIFDASKSAPGPSDTSDLRRWVQDNSTGDVVAGVNTN